MGQEKDAYALSEGRAELCLEWHHERVCDCVSGNVSEREPDDGFCAQHLLARSGSRSWMATSTGTLRPMMSNRRRILSVELSSRTFAAQPAIGPFTTRTSSPTSNVAADRISPCSSVMRDNSATKSAGS